MESADIPTLDPGATYDTASGALVENIYETLVTYKGKSVSELQGLLATSWTRGPNDHHRLGSGLR